MQLHQTGTRPLITRRLRLRRFSEDDAPLVFARWSGDAFNSRFVMARPHADVSQTREMLRRYAEMYANVDFYMWAIELDGELAGYVCANELNLEIRSACIGYCITRSHWGQGIATEAARAVTWYLFQMGFNRVFSYHNPLNPASGRVMRKCGMQLEGVIRGGSMLAGEICDCVQYAILRSDEAAAALSTAARFAD